MELKPIDKFEMNRLAHARIQELWLPGSPAGQSGHKLLHQAAVVHFGKRGWSDLNVEEMKKLYDFLDANRRLPKRGEI